MSHTKIAIIGGGNLGQSILKGLLSKEKYLPKNITITNRNIDKLSVFEKSGVNVTTDNALAVANSDIIILALKPYTVLSVLNELFPQLDPNKHELVSLASGVALAQLNEAVQNKIPVYRAMPNTASNVGESITCIATSSKTINPKIEDCFQSIGSTIVIEEDLMDAATVLGACGIAYALRFIRSMVQGGIQIGFDSKTASKIVNQTVKGAATMLIKEGNHPEFEIDKVTTPKGCTIVGLNEMEHNGFSSALIKGITKSHDAIEA
ncbi:pyrroline-5-carboxylate reductase [Crocinitomicaceae bacterium]|nr:pyrroline-5-carboxylate reductase [Crocinitomicaceae bacterium]